MTFEIETPSAFSPERDYILSVLLGDFLGLPWRRVDSDSEDVRITLQGHVGEIRLPDTLFSMPEEDWLATESLPKRGLPRWDTRDLADDVTLVEATVPLIYGDPEPRAHHEPNQVRLPVDIFGSAFFMLTRYEELVSPQRDEHDRFPAHASLAYQEGFLDRPIVDEYVEILWAAITNVWPGLERRQRLPRTVVSCDVDNPYAAYTKTVAATMRKMGGDILKRRSAPEAFLTLRNTLATRRGDYREDPFDTFDWMLNVNEAAGNRMAFYFLCDHTVPGFDGHYSIHERRIRRLMSTIDERGHEIGLHGSFGTYQDPEQMQREVEILSEAADQEDVTQFPFGARQHFLRWSASHTPSAQNNAGVRYDTTLGYADQIGFRCGTSHAFRWFDIRSRWALDLIEQPLVAMECSVIAPRYMGLGYTQEAWDVFRKIKERCRQFDGDFTLLWHNSHLTTPEDRELYADLIRQP